MLKPGDYRFTLHFRQIEGLDEEVGDVIAISFVVTVPSSPTGKLFDVYPISFGSIAIRSNDGSPALHLVYESIKVVDTSSRKLVYSADEDREQMTRSGSHLFTVYNTASYNNNYSLSWEEQPFHAYQFMTNELYRLPAGEYKISLEFAENEDGSGERYPFSYTATFGR